MANLGLKVSDVIKKFYDVQEVESIKGLYEVRELDNPNGDLLWYFFSSNNATFHSSGNDCVIRDINQSNSKYIERLKAAYEKAKIENRKIFWLVLVYGEGIGLKPSELDWMASIELKVDLDSITASLSMRKYPIGFGKEGAWNPCFKRIEQDKYFNSTFISCKDEEGQFTSKYMKDYFEIYDNRPFHDVVNYEEKTICQDDIELPSDKVKMCAKTIIHKIYEIDKFERIIDLFQKNSTSIRINLIDDLDGNYGELPAVFVLPNGKNYTIQDNMRPRIFDDFEFDFGLNNEEITCRLTTEWDDNISSNNNLNALIAIVNKRYEGVLEIVEINTSRYIRIIHQEFKYEDFLPEFKTDFARRFITSLLAKPFVILTGNSGTGKTRIAKRFAEYLEKRSLDNECNWLLIPVGADWTDNTKILGFFNPLANDGKGQYIKTEIIKLIEAANINKNVPYFLILDEMNLSHVERYFADFLSHMETLENPFIMDGYNGRLDFPDNLFVIGTVNIDETTYMFSPKVLDRANVIEFKPNIEDVVELFVSPSVNSRIQAAKSGTAEAFLRLSREIVNGKCGIEDGKLETPVKEIFEKIYRILDGTGFEFAFRTVKEIRQYISAAYEISNDKEKFDIIRSIDEQIIQKIMPKVHGNRKEIGEMLDALFALCEESNFELSKDKIEQMKGRLAKVQYASFI